MYVAVELSITAVVTILFMVPLWRLYRAGADAYISNEQQRSKRVLKDALKHAVVLTAINLLSSNNAVSGDILYRNDFPVVFDFLRTLDPVINIVTTIMLFKRNRALLRKADAPQLTNLCHDILAQC